jgi:hypothetical protein
MPSTIHELSKTTNDRLSLLRHKLTLMLREHYQDAIKIVLDAVQCELNKRKIFV